jgi:hypothetical protein
MTVVFGAENTWWFTLLAGVSRHQRGLLRSHSSKACHRGLGFGVAIDRSSYTNKNEHIE